MAIPHPCPVPAHRMPQRPDSSPWPLPAFEGDPYLIARIVPSLYHLVPLPADWTPVALRDLARTQLAANRLPACLVLGADLCLYLHPEGGETVSDDIPRGGIVVAGKLRLPAPIQAKQELLDRLDQLRAFLAEQPPGGSMFGDLTKGGRPATDDERHRLAGTTAEGVPTGLTRCAACGEWHGECLDPSEEFAGQVMQLHCRCANWNRCARCGHPLYARRLNANYFAPREGAIRHVPGFCAFDHRCS